VFIDIDHFKKVNDTYGHTVGDQVLKEAAAVFRSVTEGKGEVYRYGGEEMVAILPNHSVHEAMAVAERARQTLEAARTQDIRVTASFGVATMPDHANDSAALIKAADTAAYDAKRLGRNLVRFFGEPEPKEAPPTLREVPRRQPEPGGLPQEQKQFLRKQHLQGHEIKCPKDLTPFDVVDVTNMDSLGREFLVTCPLCGFSDTLDNPRA
jgi:diguanylate cyclase (GGDEF)-like protein